MSTYETLSIGETARKTGLSERTLRYYEAEGLLSPLRDGRNRRQYQVVDLLTLARITALKSAGFPLSQIREMMSVITMDASSLVSAQIKALSDQKSRIEKALALLMSVSKQIEHGEIITPELLCSFINAGEMTMQKENWQNIFNRYYSQEDQQAWKEAEASIEGGWDEQKQTAYAAKWADLGKRIECALPMAPTSPEARAFVEEWNTLLEPFMKVANPNMQKNVATLWANMDNWQGDVHAPLSKRVVDFMSLALKEYNS